MELLTLRECLRLAAYWCAVAAVIAVPVGIGLRSWLVPAAVFLLITAGCVVYGWVLPRHEALIVGGAALALLAGMAVGAALIGFGVHAFITAEPHCVTTEYYLCFDTAEEQVAQTRRFTMLPIIGGTILVSVLAVVAWRGAATTYREYRMHR
jgi:hypothetical protein